MIKCFSTVISESQFRLKEHYIPCVMVLLHSMKRHSECMDIPFIIFHNGLKQSTIKRLKYIWSNIDFIKVDESKYNNTKDKHNPRYFSFEIFNIIDADKVIFLDSDMLCLNDMRPLFDIDVDIGMCRETRRSCWNAGLIVLNKKYRNNEIYNNLLNDEAPDNIFGNDQKIYNHYFEGKITTIDSKWNKLVTEFDTFDNVAILHYIHKVHTQQGRSNLSKVLIDRWLDYYFECEHQYGDLCESV